jgi:hypothetical protein
MILSLKTKYLRLVAQFHKKKIDNLLSKLTKEQRFVYDIAAKLLSFSESMLEQSLETGIIYIRHDLKLVMIDAGSVHFINGKYFYYFNYDHALIHELKEIYSRHKEIKIKHMVDEIHTETTGHLQKFITN